MRGRADSFCVETDVHHPTDLNLLWDSMRCTVRHAGRLAGIMSIGGWRQHGNVTGNIRTAFHRVRTSKRAKRSPGRVEDYLAQCEKYLARARETLGQAEGRAVPPRAVAEMEKVKHFMRHAERQIDQIRRRVLQGESIPHGEKVFSIFEEHTRWVVKGKAGVPQELGVPVCVLEDQYRFILNHRVLWQEHDVDCAVGLVEQTQSEYPELRACSLDKGFHSPGNQRRLAELLDECTLPVTGHRNAESRERESLEWFRSARRQHPAIESAINHLEHCGLNRVRSHGRAEFARTVSLSVLSANLKRLGGCCVTRSTSV